MRVDIILPVTAKQLQTVIAEMLLQDAIVKLVDRNGRYLVVCNEGGRAVGVVTRLDVLRYVISDAYRPGATVEDVMTREVTVAREHDDLLEVWAVMHARDLTHVPVLSDNDIPLGVLTIDEALKALLDFEQTQELVLADYISGSGYR